MRFMYEDAVISIDQFKWQDKDESYLYHGSLQTFKDVFYIETEPSCLTHMIW